MLPGIAPQSWVLLGPDPIEVACLGLLLLRLLPWTCSDRDHNLRLVTSEVTDSSLDSAEVSDSGLILPSPLVAPLNLLLWRSLPQACFGGDHWLRPVPVDVSGLGLLPQKSLTHAWSCRCFWLRPASSVVTLL